ncbi:SurA N-terminal domain-containing protein [Roseibium sp.]|uniref:SurA N-terminal domain-containing protein n=1 Tax=Roseibium sp. TaxID=1936156 RepID=UPI003B523DAD
MRNRFVILSALLALLLAAPIAPTAEAAIKVIVNDVPITDYDITQRARLITLTQRKKASVARREALQELVDDQVKLSEAKRMGVSVSDQEVNNAYGNIARNVKMNPSQLTRALGQGGVKADTLKARLKAQLAWSKLVRRRFSGGVDVDESDIIAALRKTDEEDRKTSVEYDLKRVIVVVPKKSSNSFKAKRKREINQIRNALSSCEEMGAVLGQYSEVVVQPIGRRLETEIPANLIEQVKSLGIGKLTKPSPTPVGFEMIAICGMREIASDIAMRTKLENELRAKEGESQARRYLMDAKRRSTIIYR